MQITSLQAKVRVLEEEKASMHVEPRAVPLAEFIAAPAARELPVVPVASADLEARERKLQSERDQLNEDTDCLRRDREKAKGEEAHIKREREMLREEEAALAGRLKAEEERAQIARERLAKEESETAQRVNERRQEERSLSAALADLR